MLALGVRCGGSVDSDPGSVADAAPDVVCVPGSAGCPAPDGSSGGGGGGTAGDAGTTGGSGGGLVDSGVDSPMDAPEDVEPCPPLDGATGPCDPMAQCGCPTGSACDLTSQSSASPGTTCRPVGNANPYHYCDADPDCQAGYTCVWSACRRICAFDSDCDGVDPFRKCAHTSYGPSGKGPYGFCTNPCDPASPQSPAEGYVPCGPGFHCNPLPPPNYATGQTGCAHYSAVPKQYEGQPCTWIEHCEPAYACVPQAFPGDAGAGGPSVCRRWCHAATGALCSSPATCVPTGIYAGTMELGYCIP